MAITTAKFGQPAEQASPLGFERIEMLFPDELEKAAKAAQSPLPRVSGLEGTVEPSTILVVQHYE
jgi:hypothetical protein